MADPPDRDQPADLQTRLDPESARPQRLDQADVRSDGQVGIKGHDWFDVAVQ